MGFRPEMRGRNMTQRVVFAALLWALVSIPGWALFPAGQIGLASSSMSDEGRASASNQIPGPFLAPASESVAPRLPGPLPAVVAPSASESQAMEHGTTAGHGKSGGWWEALFIILYSDAVMSVENVLIIAILVAGIPQRVRIVATFFGLVAAGFFRILFASMATLLMKFNVVGLLGAIALIFLAISIMVDTVKQMKKARPPSPVEEHFSFSVISSELHRMFFEKGFWDGHEGKALKAVTTTVIIQDLLLSLDNVLVVAGNAHGDISLTVIGVGASILMMATMANFMVKIVQKYPVVGFIGGLCLAKAASNLYNEAYDPQSAVAAFGSILIFLMMARVYQKFTTDEKDLEPLKFDLEGFDKSLDGDEQAFATSPVSHEAGPVDVHGELDSNVLREVLETMKKHTEVLEKLTGLLEKKGNS